MQRPERPKSTTNATGPKTDISNRTDRLTELSAIARMDLPIDVILEEYKALVDKAIEKYIPRKLDGQKLAGLVGKPSYEFDLVACEKSVTAPVWDLLDRGGKRWRPALTMLVGECLGKPAAEMADVAIAAEIVHNGTLMVDDIEDGSEIRRGRPCTHKLFGVDIAVNAGNAMYYLALAPVLGNQKYGESERVKAYEAYVQEMIRLAFGQGTDIYWHNRGNQEVSERQYLQMCAFKTGTIARLAAKWGAIFAGGTDKQIEAAGKFAESLGVAFQIQDDVLNLLGEEGRYGKDPGGDVTEGKRTLLVIHALKNAEKHDAQKLEEILGEHTRDRKKIAAAIAIIRQSGAVGYADGQARKIVLGAWSAFDGEFPAQSEAKEILKKLALFAIERSA